MTHAPYRNKSSFNHMVSGGLTLFHQTGMVRAIPAGWYLLFGDSNGADMQTRKRFGAVSSRSFDLLNSMIYDLKLSVDLR